MKFDDEVAKQLDAVVGDSYDPPRRWKATITKWLVAAVLGVGMSALIVGILHTHVMKAQTAPAPAAPSKPVPVYTVPPK